MIQSGLKSGHTVNFLRQHRRGLWEDPGKGKHVLFLESYLYSVYFSPFLWTKQQKYRLVCSVIIPGNPFIVHIKYCACSIQNSEFFLMKSLLLRLSSPTLFVMLCKPVLILGSFFFFHSLQVLYFCSLQILLNGWLSPIALATNLNTSPAANGTNIFGFLLTVW